MFPFKVQLFQGFKSETEPVNTKSVVQHVIRNQVLLAAYYKADTKYCWRHKVQLFQMLIVFTTKHSGPSVNDNNWFHENHQTIVNWNYR
jgi:hypothetical protein